jgi:hypothetical protein
MLNRTQEISPVNSNSFGQLQDLLKRIFVFDDAKRITANEVLARPWFLEDVT